jgi:hypothetical protein
VTSSFAYDNGAYNVFEQGAAAEVRTGVDPNGATADIELVFSSGYLMSELWFDPDPVARTAAVDPSRTDAMSVMLHELGHAFAFNGWRDPFTGALPGDYQSTFDEQVVIDGTNFYFTGANAQAVYGGPVPVTFGNINHIGNDAPRPGSDLIPDLMNGVVFFRGVRYDISALDLAIAEDTGLALRAAAVPAPPALVLLATGVVPLAGFRWLRRRRAAA